ncbi:MAG: fibronectin type III domain-containing protein, partial [Desulfobacterales bacterium]|nr:fibronectin type III domain-containing protein [Desulfobacterales bacterium]
VAGAMRCDLVENDLGPLATAGRTVKLDIGPHAFATLRVFGSAQGPAKVAALQAEPLSDSRLRLRWQGALSTAYNVYRSAVQAAPPTAYTLVARTTVPEFVDVGLQLDSDYFYYVAAVDPSNQQGPFSEQARARTAKQNASPPSPVEDLGVVRASKEKLIVYWHKSPDPDVARFYVYRGEQPDFQIATSKPVAEIRPSGFFLETHPDTGLQPGKTYYYKVIAEDWAGNRQVQSVVAQATTPVQ